MNAKEQLVRLFDLAPHPEGGFFRETYRAAQRVRREGSPDLRNAATAIYFLLGDGSFSSWHRIQADEIWHFYTGDPVAIHVLTDAGVWTTHRLGNTLLHPGAVFQVVIPAGQWFAAECTPASGCALVGCTVAPGFEFSEFELADAAALQAAHPEHGNGITRLARPA
jgi:predicted cupin superfamily sugar epimerase